MTGRDTFFDRNASTPLAGERLMHVDAIPVLAYARPGSTDRPLVVFLPGGGHLARIAYGHPLLRREDFLDFWLEQAGFGLLALSYPSDHPVFPSLHPGMTLREWGQAAAAVTRTTLNGQGGRRSVILLGWSMAGRVVHPFCTAAEALGLQVDAFVSLAASAPLFLNADVEATLRLNAHGLRETLRSPADLAGADRFHWWRTALAEQAALNRRTIIDEALYLTAFRGNHPVNLNGERLRYRDGRLVADIAAAIDDMGSFDYRAFPITASFVPASATDLRHSFADAATWGFINRQAILRRWLEPLTGSGPGGLRADWEVMRGELEEGLSNLSATIPGGHLFFTGALGARETVAQMAALLERVRRLKENLDRRAAPPAGPSEGN